MRITVKGRYALRAVIALAAMSKDGKNVPINSLAEAEDIPPVFLEQIFYKLKKAGIVTSTRGPGGGFTFNRPLSELTLKDVFDAAGEELTLMLCDRKKTECRRIQDCVSHQVLQSITDHVNEYLKTLTIEKALSYDK